MHVKTTVPDLIILTDKAAGSHPLSEQQFRNRYSLQTIFIYCQIDRTFSLETVKPPDLKFHTAAVFAQIGADEPGISSAVSLFIFINISNKSSQLKNSPVLYLMSCIVYEPGKKICRLF